MLGCRSSVIVLAAWLALQPQGLDPQTDERGVLKITVVVLDAEARRVPVPRYVLLVSDNPPTALPRSVMTAADGTASLRLRPGSYIIESDQPLIVGRRALQWVQLVDVTEAREVVLELTPENADVTEAEPSTGDPPSLLLDAHSSWLPGRWQGSVVAVWSPTARASGFIADARGLVITSQRAVGQAPLVQVQLRPALKLAARVLEADPVRDVAVVWIDPGAASASPVPLGCAERGPPPPRARERIVALGAPLRGGRESTSGAVYDLEGRVIETDLALEAGAAGGPVFAADGRLIGISSVREPEEDWRRGEAQVIRIEEVCAAVASAELKMKETSPPSAARLPVEPDRPFPPLSLEALRTASLERYRLSSSSYDITFITPVLLSARRDQPETVARAREPTDRRTIDPLDGFSNWSAYVAGIPPVLMVRVTPRLAEGFWTRVARGAALTQGVALPPLTRFRPGFARLQAFCGDAEVTPIHPFKLEQRVSEDEGIFEGLYVFDPDALGPGCGRARLVLYSERESRKGGEVRAIPTAVLEQIWDDFAPYRASK